MQSNGDSQFLVDKMVELQIKHSEKASAIMRSRFKKVFDWLYTKIDDEEDEIKKSKLKNILGRLLKYCDILPIVSFNGQNYDIPLIRRYLPAALRKQDSLPNFVIKKGRSYMALGTDRLKYCDLVNY